MPGAPIVRIEIGHNALGELDQSKAEKGPLRVSGPGHIGGGGLFPAGAAGVVGTNAPGGIAGADPGGDTVRGSLRVEHSQRHAGVGAVGSVRGEGQVVAEVAQAVVCRLVLRPGVVLLIGHPVQGVTVQLGRVALGPADAYGLAGLTDHQRVATAHGLPLEQGQLFRQGIVAGNDIFKPGQTGVKLLIAVRLVGDTGENIGQIDQNAVLVHPAGAVQVAARPATVLVADFQPVAALVLQKSKGHGGGNGGCLGTAALGLVNGERIAATVPSGSACYVQLKIVGGCIGVSICGEGRGREHTGHHNYSQQAGNCPFPVRFNTF